MTCRRLALVLLTCELLVASANRGHAQLSANGAPERECNNWPVIAGDAKGTWRFIFPYLIGSDDYYNPEKERRGTGLVPAGKGGGYIEKEGTFVSSKPMYVGILSDSNDDRPPLEFITPLGSAIDFYPDPRSKGSIPVQSGRFATFKYRGIDLSRPDTYGIICMRGETADHLENVSRPNNGLVLFGREKPASSMTEPIPSLTDKSGTLPNEAPRPPASIRDSGLSSLKGVFPEGTKGPADAPAASGLAGAFPPEALGPRLGATELPSIAPGRPGATPSPGSPTDLSPA